MDQTNNEEKKVTDLTQTKCGACGGVMEFSPTAGALKCIQCGETKEFDTEWGPIQKYDFKQWSMSKGETWDENMLQTHEAVCKQCGASTSFTSQMISAKCAFCGTPLILNETLIKRFWKPQAIVPFKIEKGECGKIVSKWSGKKWFMAKEAKGVLSQQNDFSGVYIPIWVYDAVAQVKYKGREGVEQVKVTTNSDGSKSTNKSIIWSDVNGFIDKFFGNILVPGTDTLPKNIMSTLDKNEKESKVKYIPFRKEFLAGFTSEIYKYDFKQAWKKIEDDLREKLKKMVEEDIGGSQQEIESMDISYHDISFKLVYYPLWISTFTHKKKNYRVTIDGATGEIISGKYPKSTQSIIYVVLLVIIIIVLLFLLF